MTVNEVLWQQAEQLASQGYDIETFRDTLSNGEVVILAKNPELPGSLAHGIDRDEAIANLSEARAEYIYTLLKRGLPVPHPRGMDKTNTTSKNTAVENKVVLGFGAKVDQVFAPDARESDLSILYRGDLVKQA